MELIGTKQPQNTSKEIKSFIYVILLALAIRTFVIELFYVPTGSMVATVLEHEYIFSTKFSYGYSKYSLPFSPNIFNGRIFTTTPQRGDIVIFRPPMNMDIRYIKRLIGLPGDKVQLINDVIYINDEPIQREEYGKFIDDQGHTYTRYKETLPNGVSYLAYKMNAMRDFLTNSKYSNTEIFYVPKDHYFFLGDNRDNSKDSRAELGFVPFENFIAKGRFILFSTKEELWSNNIGIVDQIARIWSWICSIRINRLFKNINDFKSYD